MSDFRSSITFHLLYIPVHKICYVEASAGRESRSPHQHITHSIDEYIQFRNKKLLLLGMTIISSFQNAWQIISMDDIRRGHVLDMDTADDLDSHDE